MKTLTHNQRIRLTCDTYRPDIRVYSVEGYAIECNQDPKTEYSRCIENMKRDKYAGHFPVWTSKKSACLTNSPDRFEKGRLDEIEYQNSVLVENGEIVEIEGRRYKVKYTRNPINVSDPVHFEFAV